MVKAHRVVYCYYKGDIADGMCVCHSCDNPKCVNPDHLFLATQLDNIKDMLSKNRQTSAIPLDSKLEIVRKFNGNKKQITELANEYGVHRDSVKGYLKRYGKS